MSGVELSEKFSRRSTPIPVPAKLCKAIHTPRDGNCIIQGSSVSEIIFLALNVAAKEKLIRKYAANVLMM
jgi:hypothetical protein